MKTQDIKNIALALKNIREAMDPVNPKELRGKHKDRKDKDIDNDGDVDSTDKYLHKRRKAVSKAIASKKKPSAENDSNVEVQTSEAVLDEAPRKKRAPQIKHSVDPVKAERERNRAHDAAMGRTPTGRKKPERTMNSTQRQLATIRAKMANEAVEVRHDRYMRSHGKKAKDPGHSSTWMFTHKRMGEVDYDNSKEMHTVNGRFADAKKSAQKWAKSHGHSTVYVMEEVEQLDEVSKKTLGSYVKKAAKDMENRGIRQGNPQASIASVDYHSQKADKRAKGIARAVGKMAKEEVDMGASIDDIKEGTWALPDSPKAKAELKKLMSKPIKLGKEGDDAADKLYALIGDDELFDDLYVAGKKNPNGDARDVVKKHMKRLGIKEEVNLDEVSTSTLMKYRTKANRSKDRASDSAIGKMLRSKDGPQAADISKDVKTMDKRAKGLKMADRAAARNLRKDLLRKEEVEIDEAKATTAQKKELAALMRKALGGKRPKPGYTSSIATNGDFVVHDGGMRIVGRIKAGDFTNPMKEEVNLDEVSSTTMQRYKSKAGKIIDTSTDEKEIKKAE